MLSFFKDFIRRWFRNFLAVLTLSSFYPGFTASNNLRAIILAGLILSAVQVFFHPLLKFLWLPVNVITLGMFSWFLYVIHLLITTYLLASVEFIPFNYDSFTVLGILVPAGEANIIVSVVLGGIFYMFISKIIEFLTK
jgi:putative membrane protein